MRNVFWNGEEKRPRAGWRVTAQLTAMFVFLYLAQLGLDKLLGSLIPNPRGASTATLELAGSAVQLVAQLAMAASVLLVGGFLDKRRIRDFGFRFSGAWWADLGFGLALGACLMGGIFLVEWAAGWVRVTGTFVTREGSLAFWPGILVPLVGYLFVGVAEELWSRGYLLTNLAEGLNGPRLSQTAAVVIATIVQGAVFALMHATNPNASIVSTFNLFLVAFLLALGFVLTGELAISIGLHITWNFFQGNVFGFPVSGSGYTVGTFIGTEQAGPALWTGGRFGPEAGLVGIGALLVGTGLIVLWVRWRCGGVAVDRRIAEWTRR